MSALLSAPERQARLLDHVRAQHFVDAQALMEKFAVSIATVRRDLSELEAQGVLRRTHGGALYVDQVAHDQANAERTIKNAEVKKRIAAAAAALVVDGDTVIIDAGTTSLETARLLAAAKNGLTFITNGLDIATELAGANGHRLFVVGGEYHDVNHSFAGPLAAEAVRKFSADKAILSVSSIDLDRGVFGLLSPELACVQQAMLEASKTSILVADHSKFGRASLSVVARFNAVEFVITDQKAPESAEEKIAGHGSRLIRA